MAKRAIKSSSDEKIIRIETEFSIRNVGELTKKLQKNLKKIKSVFIRLERIEHIDLTAIQVIYALRKYADKKKIEFTLENQFSDKIKTLLITTGLNDLF